MIVELHIDRLVIDGIPLTAAQAARLGEAVRLELTRLLQAGALPSAWRSAGDVARLQAPDIQLARDGAPLRLGEQIAGALHGARESDGRGGGPSGSEAPRAGGVT